MYAIGKKVKGLVDVKEHTGHTWIGYPTYIIRYEHCDERGAYITAEFLPSKQTQAAIDKAMKELDFQAQGLEFPMIDSNVEMGSNCSIGGQGFGIIRYRNGVPHQIPHEGGILFKGKARLGSNVCIDRATKKDTYTTIGDNVFIDNLVHIGHNANIGDGTLIVAGSVIGGSSKIGVNCFIGENVSILQHVTIGQQVIVAAGATVTNDVEDRDIVAGVPAKSIKDKCHITDEERFRMVGY